MDGKKKQQKPILTDLPQKVNMDKPEQTFQSFKVRKEIKKRFGQ